MGMNEGDAVGNPITRNSRRGNQEAAMRMKTHPTSTSRPDFEVEGSVRVVFVDQRGLR